MLRNKPFTRTALLSAIAVTATYTAASMTSWIDPMAASITVLVGLRTTFHASAQEAARQVLGTILATIMAFAMTAIIPSAPIAIFVGLLAAYGSVRVLKKQLGDDAAITVAVPLILVVGAHFSGDQAAERVAGVILGSLAGMVASWFARPGLPHERILAKSITLAETLSALLVTVADTLTHVKTTPSADITSEWLEQAEGTLRELHDLERRALDAVDGAAWSPTVEPADAEAVLSQVRITIATAVTVVGICRDLHEAAAADAALPAPTAAAVAEVIAAAAELITEQAEVARENPAEGIHGSATPVLEADEARDAAISHLRSLEDTQPLLLGGSLLRDTDKIANMLTTSEDSPGHGT